MLSASDLSEEQIEQIKDWVSEGAQMADVQRRLKEEFELNVTYMDTRFIALDLELEFEQEAVEDDPEDSVADSASQGGPTMEHASEVTNEPVKNESFFEVLPEDENAPSVSLGLDQVAIPGSMVSGTVTFSDGERGRWMIDDVGRPSIDPDTPGYQPTQTDLEDFQVKLKHLFETQM